MPKCIIHIGMHKTGSTSIQQSLDGLDTQDFFYANILGVPNHSVSLCAMFTGVPQRHFWVRSGRMSLSEFRSFGERAKADLERSIEIAGDRTLIISGEGIGWLLHRDVVGLRAFMAKRQYHVSIIGYVRKPAAFMSSSFQQQIKAQSKSDFNLMSFYPHYRKRFASFYRTFGEDRVPLAPFEPILLKDGDVVADFCDRFGIEGYKPVPKQRNTASSRELTCLLYQYEQHRQEFGLPVLDATLARKLNVILGPDLSTKLRLSPQIVKPVLDKNIRDLSWMARRLGQSLHEDLDGELPTDIRSEQDLLKQVPGAQERILAYLSGEGAYENGDENRNIYELMARAAAIQEVSAKPRSAPRTRRRKSTS